MWLSKLFDNALSNRVSDLLPCWSRGQKTLGEPGRFSVTSRRTVPTHSPASLRSQQTVLMTSSVTIATLGQSHPPMERYSLRAIQKWSNLFNDLYLTYIHFRLILTVLSIQVVLKALDPSFDIHDPYDSTIQGSCLIECVVCFRNNTVI